jgi:hypothetical protein
MIKFFQVSYHFEIYSLLKRYAAVKKIHGSLGKKKTLLNVVIESKVFGVHTCVYTRMCMGKYTFL